MPTVKEQVQAALQQLPNDCSFEDTRYALNVLEKIHNAEESIRERGAVPHEEARRRMSSWLTK